MIVAIHKEPVLITLALAVTMTMTHALLFGPKAAFIATQMAPETAHDALRS